MGENKVESSELQCGKKVRLAQMFGDDRYADCTIIVGMGETEEHFRANRTLLARCSEVFGKMLFEQAMQEGLGSRVFIRDCSGVAFAQMLRCAHDLEPHISERNFVEVFQLARKYCVDELIDAVQTWMLHAAESPAHALRVLDAAGSYYGSAVEAEVSRMLEECVRTVVANGELVLESDAFQSCTSATLLRLLEQDSFCCDEEHLWMSLVRWGQGQTPEALRSLSQYVRFNVMSPEFFVDQVIPTNILDPAQVIELLSSRVTGRPSSGFRDCDVPRCGIAGASWRCTRALAESFECSNGGMTLHRNNYPHWKRALGRWNCDDRMQRGLLLRCNASFMVRVDHIVTQKGRYTGDILLGVAREDIALDDHSETRNSQAPAWVYSCRDGALLAPGVPPQLRFAPATSGDELRFELRSGRLHISKNGDPLGVAFEDISGPVVPVAEMNLAGSRVTIYDTVGTRG